MRRHFFKAVAVYLLGAVCLVRGGVHDGYKVASFTIPYAKTAPKIDGIVDDAEWRNAFEANALQTTDKRVSTRQTRVWMMWDEDHLYIAMRSPLRPGERPIQAFRERGRDNSKVVFDDSYEIWLNANTQSPDGQNVHFQYLGNMAGAKYDVMFEPAVGNNRPGWESGWKPVNRVTADGMWEMEVAIPRASVYRNTPFTDGTTIRGLFVRNYKDPWEQNSLGGSGSFSAPDTHCKFVLSKSAPAIHLLDVADANARTFGIHVETMGSEEPKWTFASDAGTTAQGQLGVEGAGNNQSLALDKPGEGYYRIKVTSADGTKSYLDWSAQRAFGEGTPGQNALTRETPKLNLTFNPVRNYVRVEGDFIDYDNRGEIARYLAEVVDARGKVLGEKELKLDDLAYVHGLLELGDCAPGSYIARLTCFGSGGQKVLTKETPFAKKDPAKDFPWWNTKVGNIEKVIAPWTAMTRSGNTIGVWGRTMQIGSAGLPAQVVTQQKEILAGPMQLVAEMESGTISSAAAEIKNKSDAAHRIVATVESSLAAIKVNSRVTAEFDGLYEVEMTLSPAQSTEVKSLKIVIPIKPEIAEYFHACGEGIRYGFSYGYLPKEKAGRLWSSKEVDGQPMLVGSFIPYVWVGNDGGGLSFMADSDEGWVPDDKTPAIEIRRDGNDHVDLVLNLIGSKYTIDHPRTITMAFQATPVKPIREGWRMDTWSTGDSFKDWCKVEPKGGHLIWNALPFTLDMAACKQMVDERHKQTSDYNFGISKYQPNAVPYFENNQIDKKFAPAVEYFADQWHASVSDSLCFDKTLSDFVVWNLDQWCKGAGIDGWYVDNVRPVACDNIDAGRGYRLTDGRIQPTYPMFATREFFLRVRALFEENHKSGKFVLHMTNHMILPWVGAADLALDGEDHVTFPEMGKDFMDFWSPARMRLDYPAQSGVGVTFLQEYQGAWKPAPLKKAIRAYTAMCILNDVLPGANPNGNNQEVWRGRDRFGIEAGDVKFVPYWAKDNGVTCDGDDVRTAYWQRPGAALIAVVNSGDAADATVHIDSAKLGLASAAQCSVMDADTGEALPISADGAVNVRVEHHDYRQILIKANAQP